ncbi:hypothetical protein MVEG_10573 [Podila verticillata NRRL 6337]|nr:hypothetical protein MVEG_10573 [Podila verticillata NRRL 6337]
MVVSSSMTPSANTEEVTNEHSPLATPPFSRLPTEIQEQIFSRIPQRNLRQCVSLVCKQWHFVSRRHIRRIARWKTINMRSTNKGHLTTHALGGDLLLHRIRTGLVTTLICSFFFDSTLKTQPLWDFADQSDELWKGFVETLTRPLNLDSMPSLSTLFVQTEVKDDFSDGHETPLSLAVQPCLLHQMREVMLRGYLDFKLHLKPLLKSLSYVQVLVIEQLKTVGDWTLDLDLSELLASCPNLKRLGITGPPARFVRLTGELNEDKFPSGKLKKKAHGLIELSVGRVEVRVSTLKELVSLCPSLQVFRVQDIRPMVPSESNSRSVIAATETVQRELDQLIEEAQWLCPNLRWMAVTTREGIWSDQRTLEALERYLGPQRAINSTETIGRVASKIHQLTLSCYSTVSGQYEHLKHPRIFDNLTFLRLTGTTVDTFRRPINHRILSQCTKLEHLSMDPGLYLYVGDMVDLAHFNYPAGALPAPAAAFVAQETGSLSHQHRKALTRFLHGAQWTLADFLDSPPWVRNRILASQPNLISEEMSVIVEVPPQQLTQLAEELASLTLAPRTLWACHGLRTLDVQLDPGFYELGVFGTFLAETCPRLELVHIRYARLRMGQMEENQRYDGECPTGRFLNELLPMRGLNRLRTFEIVIEKLIGNLYAEDFRFLAREGDYGEGDEGDGDSDEGEDQSEDQGDGFEDTIRTQRRNKGPTTQDDVFWPKLEVFMVEAATVRKETFRGQWAQFQWQTHQQIHQKIASDGFGSVGMLQKLARMRPEVEFKFLKTYWDGRLAGQGQKFSQNE